MALSIEQIHPCFVGRVSGVDLRQASEDELAQLRAGMDQYGVLVFHGQPLGNEEQLEFSQRFDGVLHTKTSLSVLEKNRFGSDALTDISNVNNKGELLQDNDRRRVSSLSNRLWHTDASFQDPAGRYSMLSCKMVPPVRTDTEYADMYTAYDTLDDETKALVEPLSAFHSIVYSRHVLGFEFSDEERGKLPGAVHPLVRVNPNTGRRSLYLASHASHIIDWPVPEGRALLRDLTEHATRRELVYSHDWRPGDFVIWDNRATMHRGTRFDDKKHPRELRRTTTLDVELATA
ncbi:TauD/TfdA dioxygenase family protein [Bordetella petrii]|uniref:TauD/TfdA dioxygenase family protein n=1 Tax=Bordetella petrii TaxID=94624 RepID=UPI001E29FC04|nr:TauD/TfdA family dioxygenase [Bordetella petrii]MCD0503378.1 TauD/TfdA family dioxygenase [Bordetella petrii]